MNRVKNLVASKRAIVGIAVVVPCLVGGSVWAAITSTPNTTANTDPYAGYPPGVVSAASSAGKTLPTFSQGPGYVPGSTALPGQNFEYPYPPNTNGTGQASGILDLSQAPFSQQDFTVANQYYGTYDGQHLVIWAGVKNDATGTVGVGQSAIRYQLGDGSLQTYVDSAAAGELKLTGVSGSIVSFEDSSGITGSFDLASNSFGM